MIKVKDSLLILDTNHSEFLDSETYYDDLLEITEYVEKKTRAGLYEFDILQLARKSEHLSSNALYNKFFELEELNQALDKIRELKESSTIEEIVDFDFSYKNDKDFKDFVDIVLSRLNIEIKGEFGEITKKQLTAVYKTSKLGNSLNFSDPGSGKTLMTLMDLASKADEDDFIIISCPVNSMFVWGSEIKKFVKKEYNNKVHYWNENYSKYSDEKRSFGDIYNQRFIICNYESLHKFRSHGLAYEKIKENGYFMVFDEAHRVKSKEAKRNITSTAFATGSKGNITLTGTPISKSMVDLSTIIELTWSNRENPFFDSEELNDFIVDYDMHLANLNEPSTLDAISRMSEELSNLYINLSKTKDFGIEPAIDNHEDPLLVDKTPSAQAKMDKILYKRYKDAVSRLLHLRKEDSKYEDTLNSVNTMLTALLTNATNPILLKEWKLFEKPEYKYYLDFLDELVFEKLPKIQIALKRVKELVASQKRVIVWFNFVQNIEQFNDILLKNKINSKIIHGETKIEDRREIINSLASEDSDIEVLVSNPATIAESVSLHKSIYNSIFVERDYVYFRWAQAKDRIHRVGSDGVVVHDYIKDNKLLADNEIFNKMSKKKKYIEEILGSNPFLSLALDYEYFEEEESEFKSDINILEE